MVDGDLKNEHESADFSWQLGSDGGAGCVVVGIDVLEVRRRAGAFENPSTIGTGE